MRTADLTVALLDYWVARAEGYGFIEIPPDAEGNSASRVLAPPGLIEAGWMPAPRGKYGHMLKPWSTDWAHGGPIIEREQIEIILIGDEWFAFIKSSKKEDDADDAFGSTPIIAAMRAYVASKYGEEVPDVDSTS